jgi:hypothetical protein
MRKIIFFCLMICFTTNVNAYDYKPGLENALIENRVAFDPMVVEDTIRASFWNRDLYDMKKAAQTYDMIAARNNGYVSLEELFYVCLKAFKVSPTNPWYACQNTFIIPLAMNANDTSFIDDVIVEAYDGHAFDKWCWAPETDTEGLAPNAICTTGRYEKIDPIFEKAMITKFRTEGGCAYVKDGNGKTCYGVAGRYHPAVYRTNPPFTRADAEDIAYNEYYKKHGIYKLPDAIRGDVFMAFWGTGDAEKSVGLLQEILGVEKTNRVNEETIQAAANFTDGNLRKKFLKARWNSMKNSNKFSNGWAKAFQVYLKNGCHTVPKKPLNRNAQTMAECPK